MKDMVLSVIVGKYDLSSTEGTSSSIETVTANGPENIPLANVRKLREKSGRAHEISQRLTGIEVVGETVRMMTDAGDHGNLALFYVFPQSGGGDGGVAVPFRR